GEATHCSTSRRYWAIRTAWSTAGRLSAGPVCRMPRGPRGPPRGRPGSPPGAAPGPEAPARHPPHSACMQPPLPRRSQVPTGPRSHLRGGGRRPEGATPRSAVERVVGADAPAEAALVEHHRGLVGREHQILPFAGDVQGAVPALLDVQRELEGVAVGVL